MKNLISLTIFALIASSALADEYVGHKKAKSIFNIVTFKNSPCRSTSSISGNTGSMFRNGTCYTKSECANRGGTVAGDCASGFGVCCVFLVTSSGGQVTQNCTYVRNPNFPSSYDSSNAGSISYTVNKCDPNVCSLRLDFETFNIQGTGDTEEIDTSGGAAPYSDPGGVCQDTFTLTTNSQGKAIPVICGQNSGQHIYADIGALATDTAQIQFQFTGTATNRNWEIKVTQVPCDASYREPEGCLQYHTGLTGRFRTFNFDATQDNHLRNQDYSVCIRQEAGFCCVQYSVCSDTSSFSLNTAASAADTAKAMTDSKCTESVDWIGISGSSGQCYQGNSMGTTVSKYCGGILAAVIDITVDQPICDCTAPFIIDVHTDSNADLATDSTMENKVHSRGVCLEWMQIPCQG